MITWHTRFSFGRTGHDLDTKTLAFQIKQAWDVFTYLTSEADVDIDESHPVLQMWTGYEVALAAYGMELGLELTMVRRQQDDIFYMFYRGVREFKKETGDTFRSPPWFKDADLCRSHRSNLQRRQPEQYGTTWPKTPVNMPYLWPFVHEDGTYDLMVVKEERELLKSGERKLPLEIKKRVANL